MHSIYRKGSTSGTITQYILFSAATLSVVMGVVPRHMDNVYLRVMYLVDSAKKQTKVMNTGK